MSSTIPRRGVSSILFLVARCVKALGCDSRGRRGLANLTLRSFHTQLGSNNETFENSARQIIRSSEYVALGVPAAELFQAERFVRC